MDQPIQLIVHSHDQVKLRHSQVRQRLFDPHCEVQLFWDPILVGVDWGVGEGGWGEAVLDVVAEGLQGRVVKLNHLSRILCVQKHSLQVVLACESDFGLLLVDLAFGPKI